MIPKVIHYCWFGKNPLTPLAVKCIKSWRKYCPGYEIVEWNEDNFPMDDCEYIIEAYREKKWAFISDYARFKILYENGGLYFDTDVELFAPIDDLLEQGPFMAKEKVAGHFPVNAGNGVGFESGNVLLKELMDDYKKDHFIDSEGKQNLYTVVERVTDKLRRGGLRDDPSQQSVLGINILPPEVMCPYDYDTHELHCTDRTISIHWYDASWLDEKAKKRQDVCVKIQKMFRGKTGYRLSRIYASISFNLNLLFSGEAKTLFVKLKKKIAGK